MTAKSMMHEKPVDLNLTTFTQCAPETVQAQPVVELVLALGSNYQADKYLPLARQRLAALGEVRLSTAFQNPDFTATTQLPKPDYTNQCVHLTLTTPMSLQQLQQTFKTLEGDCNRCRQTEPNQVRQVTMDIDILMIKLATIENSLSKYSIFKSISDWIVMADRYPFKTHEEAGVRELAVSTD
ncbi:2-amino-4-hydroxy-6-hydroxymethyldihydropteridine diphosphokinase [uncultured Psychrobacter sp.]|uniref:2-amino-4-hydroxy-6- hydroxymethyldihydropteridine diphosphokinase n=1 Tax=uncultured Psychrobacter sp. TaxID=259303 RepID=UPI00262C1D92|nr:2-amino-4-hydroxy-6-hydroxymethyldihydropteridine diphosphokinase [uncultured Psychrobacter sp.]